MPTLKRHKQLALAEAHTQHAGILLTELNAWRHRV
jgi:hypothetical protein